MKNQLLHTPDGVRDIYNGECKKKLELQNILLTSLHEFGYQDIQTPSFEYFDVFGNQIGTTPSRDLYKFFDKNGNTLVLRPDFTPSIARCAVKYYMDDDMPVKLCYMGNTFTNSSEYQGRFKEVTQCGAESIGDASIYADAEILAMTVDALKKSGLKEFQISVGHSQFFSGLIQAADIDEDTAEELKEYLLNKNFFGVEEILHNYNIEENLMQLFALLGKFDASSEDICNAMELSKKYPQIYKALQDLALLYDCLKIYQIDKYISYELGIISDYHYYTGIIFAGYTFGTGEAIVKGGRYDKLLNQFGRDCPAIGFAIVVDQLMAALTRQKIDIPVADNTVYLVYKKDCYNLAIEKAISLRQKGAYVETILWDETHSQKDYEERATRNNVKKVEFMEN